MRTFAKRCIRAALLFSCLSLGYGIHEALCAEPGATSPTAKELVEKLRIAQAPLKCSITKSETYTQWSNDYSNSPYPEVKRLSGEKDLHSLTEMRYDGRRYAVRARQWGTVGGPGKTVLESNPTYTSWLWDGTQFYNVTYLSSDPAKDNLVTIGLATKSPEKHMGVAGAEMELRGEYAGASETVEAVLAGARSLKLRDKPEQIGGSDCQVLEADTKYGRYVVWIDPAHGYNVARAEVSKGKGDVSGTMDTALGEGMTQHYVLENVRFAEVDGAWVPMECDTCTELTTSNGTSKAVTHHKRTEVKLNPDFETLRSFVPDDIKEGATAYVAPPNAPRGVPLVRCIWHNGKPVPVDGGGPRKGRGNDAR